MPRGPLADAEFERLLDRLGPFERQPLLAAAVSGGADSLALCLLAQRWAESRQGRVIALVCDHGLRPRSGEEASLVAAAMRGRGLVAVILTLAIPPGPGLARRAREARYAALERECRARGILHLLLGHHAGDQAETVAMRLLRGSGPSGLSAMAAVTEGREVRLLRPLLAVPPARLRDTAAALGASWLEDPTNRDASQLRPRLRQLRRDRSGDGPVVSAAVVAAAWRARRREGRDRETARALARSVCLHPAGFALIQGDLPPEEALSAVIQVVSGASRPPSLAQAAAWRTNPRAATLGGAQIHPAGRLCRGGWLFARELAAVEPPVALAGEAWWDRRFRLLGVNAGSCGALGAQAAEYRHLTPLPLIVLRTLPAIRLESRVIGIPHLNVGNQAFSCVFSPSAPLSGVFFPPDLNQLATGMHKAG